MHDLHCSVLNKEQFMVACKKNIGRIYISCDVAHNLDEVDNKGMEIYLMSPSILRKEHVENFLDCLKRNFIKGILVKDLNTFALLVDNIELFRELNIVLDSSMYIWNSYSLEFFINSCDGINEFYSPFELNLKEIELLNNKLKGRKILNSYVVYGRIPMMISANCVNKTLNKCTNISGFSGLNDRTNRTFPVYNDCNYCYNIIYNSLPISLHDNAKRMIETGNIRLDFSMENVNEMEEICDYFWGIVNNLKTQRPYGDYTTGHIKRGVE